MHEEILTVSAGLTQLVLLGCFDTNFTLVCLTT